MIGGIDINIPTNAGASSMEVAVRAIMQSWPRSVFENGLTGERYEYFRQIPFGEVKEIFVYRDSLAAEAWDAEGAVPDIYNTMVHLIADQGMITVVVDVRDAAIESVIAAISSGLSDEILYLAAELEAA
jgi:hypothetical protein